MLNESTKLAPQTFHLYFTVIGSLNFRLCSAQEIITLLMDVFIVIKQFEPNKHLNSLSSVLNVVTKHRLRVPQQGTSSWCTENNSVDRVNTDILTQRLCNVEVLENHLLSLDLKSLQPQKKIYIRRHMCQYIFKTQLYIDNGVWYPFACTKTAIRKEQLMRLRLCRHAPIYILCTDMFNGLVSYLEYSQRM